MKWPVGDFLRSLHPKGIWKKILDFTKGITINFKGHEIQLDEKHGGVHREEPPQFNQPHEPVEPK